MSGGRAREGTRTNPRPRRVHIAQLVGRRVETSAGERIGRVVDLELVVDVGGVRVVGVELGTAGLFDRLHLLRPLRQRLTAGQEPHVVPWEDVERLQDGRIIVREGRRSRAG